VLPGAHERLGRQVFGIGLAAGAIVYVLVNALRVALIELAEGVLVGLGLFDQRRFVRVAAREWRQYSKCAALRRTEFAAVK
jgi:hypothetical protein